MAIGSNSSPKSQPASLSGKVSPRVSVSTWGLQLRQGGFASVELNFAGWLALLSPGVVSGLLVARLTDGSFVLFGLIGGFVIWFGAVVADRLRSSHIPSLFSVAHLSERELEKVEESARYAGIKFEHDVDDADEPTSIFRTKTKYVTRLRNLIELARDSQ